MQQASNEDRLRALWSSMADEAGTLCGDMPALVRQKRPLVHLLTNYVTVTDCVNAVLAVGGRAICSHAPDEAAEVCLGSDALVLNLGGTEYYQAMDLAAGAAASHDIPIVIDPVGCSASRFRRDECLRMTEAFHPAAIRGNYAEIAALIEGHSEGSGLDSTILPADDDLSRFKESMSAFAGLHGLICIASGPTDLCTDGRSFLEVSRGTPALRRITGAGCLSTAVLAAYLAARPGICSAVSALNYIALAGETAQKACRLTNTGAGHFHMFFMDALGSGEPI